MVANWRTVIAVVVLVPLAFIATQTSTTGQVAERPGQWQYRVESGSDFNVQRANLLGADGWELVLIYQQHEGEFRAVFKHPSVAGRR